MSVLACVTARSHACEISISHLGGKNTSIAVVGQSSSIISLALCRQRDFADSCFPYISQCVAVVVMIMVML